MFLNLDAAWDSSILLQKPTLVGECDLNPASELFKGVI